MERILQALASERFASLDDAARDAEEWLLRRRSRRAAERALDEAATHTRLTETVDLARVALLRNAGVVPEGGFDDARAVALAFAGLPVTRPRRIPVALIGLGSSLGVTAALAFVGWSLWLRPFDAASTRVGRAFAGPFTDHVVRVANGARPSPEQAIHDVFSRGSLDEAEQHAMTALFDAQINGSGDPSRMLAVFHAVQDVNEAFRQHVAPWYVDATYHRSSPILYAFYIEREDEARAEGYTPERVEFLWRLDRVNISKPALGYTHREATAALVLYDQIEEFLIRDVLPALVEGEKVELVDEGSRDPKAIWQEDIETRAARMVRESFAGEADRDRLVALGRLLSRRRAIVRRWREELGAQGRTLREPKRLLPEADYAAALWHVVPSASRNEWDDIHAELASNTSMTTFQRLRDRFADGVARHELQHRFDAQRTKDCADDVPCATMFIPAAVKNRVGPDDDAPVLLGSLPSRVRQETSAYLAEMARPGGTPKMTILSLLRTLLDRDAWGDVYCHTTIVLLDVLATEFGLVDDGMPLVARGAVQRGSVASLAAVLFSKTDEELRAATEKIWRSLYGQDLPHATFETVRRNTPWRH